MNYCSILVNIHMKFKTYKTDSFRLMSATTAWGTNEEAVRKGKLQNHLLIEQWK